MRISPRFVLIAPALMLAASCNVSPALAQETLAGVGAASAMGAGLGAATAGTMSLGGGRGGRGLGSGAAPAMADGTDPAAAGMPSMPGVGTVTTQTTVTTTRTVTPLAALPNGGSLLSQLLSVPYQPQPTRVRRSAPRQAAYARSVSRLSPTARKKLVLGKYRIPPRGWLSSYLPQDRYKFAKAWQFVSTETDRFYYRPQAMAQRRFSPNRVIGFRTWQDAMLAGYRPDPGTKPEPGNQFAYFATLTRDEPLVRYLEYAYAGQVSPSSLTATYNYVRRVKAIIDRNPHVKQYQRSTVNAILEASLTGDSSLIPTQLGAVAAVPVAGGIGQPQFPGAPANAASPGVPQVGQVGPPAGFRPPTGPPAGFGGPPAGFTPPTGPPPGFRPPTGPPPGFGGQPGGGSQ